MMRQTIASMFMVVVTAIMISTTLCAQPVNPWMPPGSGGVDTLYHAPVLVLTPRVSRVEFRFNPTTGQIYNVAAPTTNTGTLDILETLVPTQCTPPQTIKRARLRAILQMGDDYIYGKTDFDINVDLSFTVVPRPGPPPTGVIPGAPQALRIRGNTGTNVYEPEQHWIKDFTIDYDRIDEITVTAAPTTGLPFVWPPTARAAGMQGAMKIIVYYEEEFNWPVVQSGIMGATPMIDLIPVPTDVNGAATQNPVAFSWKYALDCSDSIPAYELQVLRLYNVDATKTTQSDITADVDWSQAMSIIVDGNMAGGIVTQKLTLAEGTGYYAWRVRPVGTKYAGGIADHRNWGVWTNHITGNQAITDPVSKTSISDVKARDGVFFYPQFDDRRNWQYARVFSEGTDYETKIGERIEYANTLKQTRQTQARIATATNTMLISNTVLDYSGRPAVQTLGTPVANMIGFGYVSDLFLRGTTGGTYGAEDEFQARDFDQSIADKPLGSVLTYEDTYLQPKTMRQRQGAGVAYDGYYSDQTSDLRVPNAELYPYTRIMYSRDGTERARERGGVGNVHRIGGSAEGTTRTVRTMWGTATDQELIWLFGDEAPAARTVRKQFVTDANNVTTISYLDKDGKTLASALSSGDLPTADNPGLGNSPRLAQLVNDPTFPASTVQQEITQFDQRTPYGMSASYKLALPEPTTVTLDYHLDPEKVAIECPALCVGCDYIVEVYIHDIEDAHAGFPKKWTIPTDPVTNNPVLGSCADNNDNSGDGNIDNVQFPSTPISVYLEAGSYLVERRIRLRNTIVNASTMPPGYQSGETYLNGHQRYIRTLIERDQLGVPSYGVSAAGPLKDLLPLLEEGKVFGGVGAYGWLDARIVSDPTHYSFDAEKNEYVVVTACCTLRIPKKACDDGACAGGTPNFEQEFKNAWQTKYPIFSTRDIFYRNGTELYPVSTTPTNPYPNGNGAFNAMIANMLAETSGGNPVYKCADLWNAWKGIISIWETLGADKEGNIDKEFDLMDYFLRSVGKMYTGISTTEYHATAGYLSHAYKYFEYNGTSDPDCNTQVGYPWTGAPKWQDLYDCINNNGRTTAYDDEFVPPECDPATTTTTAARVACMRKWLDSITDGCEDRCDEQWDAFVRAIITEYHQQPSPKVVEGDEVDGVPVVTWDISREEVYCKAQALVDRCKEECRQGGDDVNGNSIIEPGERRALTVTYAGNGEVQSVGTDPERAALKKALTWTFEVALVDGEGECPEGFEKVSSKAGNNQGRVLVEFLNWRLRQLRERAGALGYEDPDYACQELQDVYDRIFPGAAIPNGGKLGAEILSESTNACWPCECEGDDEDEDEVKEPCDNCPEEANANQKDDDLDGVGDACDNCVSEYNPTQLINGSWPDTDSDGKKDPCDNCPEDANASQTDDDGDYVGNVCDNCPSHVNRDQLDSDADGKGDVCDPCPYDPTDNCSFLRNDGDMPEQPALSLRPENGQQTPAGDSATAWIRSGEKTNDLVAHNNPFKIMGARRDIWRSVDVEEKGGGTHVLSIEGGSPDQSTSPDNEPSLPEIDPECPKPYGSDILRQGIGITGRFILGEHCQLIYERTCTRGGETKVERFVLCPDICGRTCNTSICFKWVEPDMPEEPDNEFKLMTCEATLAKELLSVIGEQARGCVEEKVEEFSDEYRAKCTALESLDDNLLMTYGMKYYHFTLFYYDRAGNLIRTVQPKGVSLLSTSRLLHHPSHQFVTGYEYNSLGHLVRKITPNEGMTESWMDGAGRMRFSQSARQRAMKPERYGYTKYDALNRIIETGEAMNIDPVTGAPAVTSPALPGSVSNPLFAATVNDPAAPIRGRYDIVGTAYTSPTNEGYLNLPGLASRPRYLRNRVSMRWTDAGVKTVYSYDPHGNIEWMMQDMAVAGLPLGLHMKNYVRYEYDLINGMIKKVSYDDTWGDRFYQRYKYDADQRLQMVESSRDGEIWDRDAQYEYALHGVLQRYRIGEDKLQTVDYAYTIQGWLKGMNHFPLNGSIGGPGMQSDRQQGYAYDAFATILRYYEGDFSRSYSMGMFQAPWNSGSTPNIYALGGTFGGVSVYNGNISSWTLQYAYNPATPTAYTPELSATPNRTLVTGETYRYDVLNRLLSTRFHIHSGTVWDQGGRSGDYDMTMTYDPNGNIESLQRRGNTLGKPQMMDNLTYAYMLDRLVGVTDAANGGAVSPYAGDIENPAAWVGPPPPPAVGNYSYDPSGNLVEDWGEGAQIRWNAYGKVTQVRRLLPAIPPGPPPGVPPMPWPQGDIRQEIFFVYNAANNRVAKYVLDYKLATYNTTPGHVRQPGDPWEGHVTYYVRDANEQVVAIYERDLHTPYNDDPCWPDYPFKFGRVDADLDRIDDAAAPLPPPVPPSPTWPPMPQTTCDNCPGMMGASRNPWQEDYDGDGLGDACDPCPLSPNIGGSPCVPGPGGLVVAANVLKEYQKWEISSPGFPIKLSEQHIYGNGSHGLVAILRPDRTRDITVQQSIVYTRELRKKEYQMKDHLGNVRAVLSDLKLDVSVAGLAIPTEWEADVKVYTQYYAYGQAMPDRQGGFGGHRYGYNGMEMDKEMHGIGSAGIGGEGTSYTTEHRMLDVRLGRWWSPDPVSRADISMYASMSDNPIIRVDPKGDDDYYSEKGEFLGSDGRESTALRLITKSEWDKIKTTYEKAVRGKKNTTKQEGDRLKSLDKKSKVITVTFGPGDLKQMWDDSRPDEPERTDRIEQAAYIVLDTKNATLDLQRHDATYNTHSDSRNPTPNVSVTDDMRSYVDKELTKLIVAQVHTHPASGTSGGQEDPIRPNGTITKDVGVAVQIRVLMYTIGNTNLGDVDKIIPTGPPLTEKDIGTVTDPNQYFIDNTRIENNIATPEQVFDGTFDIGRDALRTNGTRIP